MAVILALWLLVQLSTVAGVLLYLRYLPDDWQEGTPKGAVVILSVRDDWDGGADLLARLRAQNAPFRLLVATSGNCPAAEALAAREADWVQIVRAGVAQDEGQKVHKQRAALRVLRPDDRFLVFVDADIAPPPRMVGRLLFPLVYRKADITSGCRLLVPAANLVSALTGAVEMQVITQPRFAHSTPPWGGAMAMRRETADRIDFDGLMAGRLSDDLTLAWIGRKRKLRMRPVRDLLIASPFGGSSGDAWRFGIRQYRHVGTNSVAIWQLTAAGLVGIHVLGWIWALAWGGWSAVAVGYAAAWVRVAARWHIVDTVAEPEEARAILRRTLAWDAVAPFIVTWTHMAIQIVAASSNRIRWGGWDYRVRKGKVVWMRPVDQKPAGN